MHFMDLPIDILVNIFKYLSLRDIYNLMLTCKTIKNLIQNENAIWRAVCRGKLIIHDGEGKLKSSQSWFNRCRISNNWCKGIYKSKTLITHRINYMPWLQYTDQCLLLTIGPELCCYPLDKYGVPNCKDLYWKLTMPVVERYDIRTNDISRFVLKDNLLVCGNRNGSTAVYRIDNINTKPYLIQYIQDCHNNGLAEVSSVDISNKGNEYMVTASGDSNIVNLWTWNSGGDLAKGGDDVGIQMSIELEECVGAKCVSLNSQGDTLAIGADGDSLPVLIDVHTASILTSSDESRNVHKVVRDICWRDAHTVCCVTHCGMTQCVDTRTRRPVYSARDQFQSSYYCVSSDGCYAIIAGASEYSRCDLYDIRAKHHVQLYFTQKKYSPVYSLAFDSSKLLAAVDRCISLLNFNVSAANTSRDYSDVFRY